MDDLTINSEVTMSGENATVLAGRYRIVRQLGQGGMGSVWLAEDVKLDGFKVAIKMLPSVLVNNKRAYAQVKAEALVSLKLSHPNIVTVRAFEEEGGSPFLVMDYIDGQTLDDYLAEKGKLSEEETLKLLKPVAAALDYAHAQGVVHRDVKPGNVMIRKDGTPFVLDFGIAREIQETMTRVTGKLSSGTLMYMSPEQLHGAAPKPAQDIYSFAAMAYECLTGHPPFSRGQIEYQIEHDMPAVLDSEFSIAGGVMTGLSKQTNERPTTCAEVLTTASIDSLVVMCDNSNEELIDRGNMNVAADQEFDRIRAEIKRCEDILKRKEAEKKVEQEAQKRAHALREAKLRLEKLRPLFKGADRPVENVSWNDCQRFVEKINAAGDVIVSLPTEAQWEYACRAGTTGSYAGELENVAWWCDNSTGETHLVGRKKPNAWGLYDMHGNVSEWCLDWYGGYPKGSVPDPMGPTLGANRVFRGGSWCSVARACRSAFRNCRGPGFYCNDLGLRLVCPAGLSK